MNTLWGKTVTNQPKPGPERPLRCLDNITNYSRNSEPRIYHLSESNAFFVFRFMRKFLSCQNMFRFFLRQKRRSAFSQRTPFCLWSWWLRLNSLWLIQWSINRIVTGHHCDYDNSLFYYWSKKSINLYCNWSSSNMTNLKGRSGPTSACDCRGIVLQAMREGFGHKLGQQVTLPTMV